MSQNTIFARASGVGKSGVAVFRISGPASLMVAQKFLKSTDLIHRYASFAKIYHPISRDFIDDAILLYFQAPNSFTGEDVVEFHLHGSIAVGNIFTEAILSCSEVRMAEAGEFAKRAFLNGKMDLTSAEGLADLIDAETILQHKQASRQMNGELNKLYSSWRERLLKILALLEAYIDFPDEDIPTSIINEIAENTTYLKKHLSEHLNDNMRGERLRNGIYLSIFGAPNAGKSSLVNFLARRDVAIVSEIAGTTRDIVEVHLDIGGFPIILADTAGIRFSDDQIEKQGIDKAKKNTQNADIKILVIDITDKTPLDQEIFRMIDENTIILLNKIDLAVDRDYDIKLPPNAGLINISIKSEIGLDNLLTAIENIASKIAMPSETPAITRLRYRSNITKSLESLQSFEDSDDIILKAEDIRLAARYLSILTGKIDVEAIIGEIFANFCIGK
jgi:tRNA modification GTPase